MSSLTNSSPSSSVSPRLALPGAGLPAPELLVARLLFTVRRRLTSRAAAEARIREEQARIDTLLQGCDPEKCRRPVLIKRPRRLEDSSRH